MDLTSCDAEPLHIPGAIQPHGALLALRFTSVDVERDEPSTTEAAEARPGRTLSVEQFSANAESFLGLAARLRPGIALEELFPGCSALLEAVLRLEDSPPQVRQHLDVRSASGALFACAIHRNADGVFIAELESATDRDRSELLEQRDWLGRALPATLLSVVRKLRSAGSQQELCRTAADALRELTGFDRVVIHRFDEAGSAEAVAESRRPDLAPHLSHDDPGACLSPGPHRAATDLWLRSIASLGEAPVPLEPSRSPSTGKPLDMTFCSLRALSRVQREHLESVGVRALLSMYIARDDELWGLISCYRYAGPHAVPQALREAAQLVGQALSSCLAALRRREEAERASAARSAENRLLARLNSSESFLRGLAGEELLELTGAAGAAAFFEGEVCTVGVTPDAGTIRQLCEWLAAEGEEVYSTDRAQAGFAARAPSLGDPLGPEATGILAVALSRSHGEYLLWFRPAREREASSNGALRLERPAGDDGAGSSSACSRALPRRSLPWLSSDVEAASNVRRLLLSGVRRRTAELADANERLTRLGRAKDMFLATLGHELRTPLNAILGWTRLLLSGKIAKDRWEHALEVIDRNARAQSRLIEDLLDMSRIANGKLSLNRLPVDMGEVVGSALESVTPAADARGIQLRIALQPGLPPVLGDASRLQQVVCNLLSNAIKFTHRGGHVDVLLAGHRDELELQVRDDGRGITPEFLPYVFQEFRQGIEASAEDRSGLGLGLAIVEHLVSQHGGRVSAASDGVGRGARFTVTLPAAPGLDSSPSLPERAKQPT